ncbi:MAG: GNAT family N-acetyltransferase [Methanomassiliicoccus sp.]|nr:GNAT family N-acetyltransferase [Methanomassiliicoccus sp.]
MGEIRYEIVRDGGIEQCRELCDELMSFQRSKARMRQELFDAMNFDTRMRPSYERALDKQVVVAKDDGVPVGYVLSTIDSMESMTNSPFKLLPPEDALPPKIGCLSNLYVREGYRGTGMGSRLFDQAMEWLTGFKDVDRIYVFISNGNDAAHRFYAKRGFVYSHEVLGGFITALRLKKDPSISDRNSRSAL